MNIKITSYLPIQQVPDLSESLKYFLKMELCTIYRKYIAKGFFSGVAIKMIKEKRKEIDDEGGLHIHIIDQIKNDIEYDVLSFVYSLNYIQISLFSNENERLKCLEFLFKNDNYTERTKKEFRGSFASIENEIKREELIKTDIHKYLNEIQDNYEKDILPNALNRLIKKDFKESNENHHKSGQQISKVFHLSHYYFNLDVDKTILKNEINKFIKLLRGNYLDYPSQDEFGMSLAFQASVRSNFPGNRHIGACILSSYGEVISVASIRAPSQLTNTSLNDEMKVADGYHLYKEKM